MKSIEELNAVEVPHFMAGDVDCGGQFRPGYWRKTAWCSDDTCVLGCGHTEIEAIRDCENRRLEKENFLSQSDLQKLKFYTNSEKLYDAHQKDMLRIIGRMLIKLHEDDTCQPS